MAAQGRIRIRSMAAKPKPPAPDPIPRHVDVTRVWFVSLRKDGRRGNVVVNAPDWQAAGKQAASLSGGEPQTIRAETFTLNEVMWDEE
jgi:hypothetical protein